MIAFEFGDVVLVPFPFTDQSAAKQRPAVVISSQAYHRARPDVLIMAVTSQTPARSALHEAPIRRWREAGLIKPSVLKAAARHGRAQPHQAYARPTRTRGPT